MNTYQKNFLLPGIGLILLAFFAGSAANLVLAMLGFLAFFVMGVTLIIEGKRRTKDKS